MQPDPWAFNAVQASSVHFSSTHFDPAQEMLMEHFFFSGIDSPGHWACRDENFVKSGQFSGGKWHKFQSVMTALVDFYTRQNENIKESTGGVWPQSSRRMSGGGVGGPATVRCHCSSPG